MSDHRADRAPDPAAPPAAAGAEVRLRAGDTELTVRPDQGCRISSLTVHGTELLVPGEEFGSFVMAPWCGRHPRGLLRDGGRVHQLPTNAGEHAMHGTVWHQRWRTVHQPEHGRSAAFLVKLADPWPYPGSVTQTLELAEDGSSLTLALGVEAAGESFPAQAGWHPWFRRRLRPGDDSVRIAMEPAAQLERGPDGLPNGRRITPLPGPWDDCFSMPDGVDVTLTWPGALRLRMTSPAKWVVVYDEPADAVCVEPQSGPPGGLASHPRLVTRIDPLEIRTTWSWTQLVPDSAGEPAPDS